MASIPVKGVVTEVFSARGMVKTVVMGSLIIAGHLWLQKRAVDASKKDSLPNKFAGVLGYSGAGIAA